MTQLKWINIINKNLVSTQREWKAIAGKSIDWWNSPSISLAESNQRKATKWSSNKLDHFAVFFALKAENFLARISEHLLLVCAAKFANIGRKGEKGATGKGCLIVTCTNKFKLCAALKFQVANDYFTFGDIKIQMTTLG